MIPARRVVASLLALAAVAGMAACGGSSTSPSQPSNSEAAASIAVVVDPAHVELAPAAPSTFAAAVTGTVNRSVSWTVTEAGGGTVDAAGNYIAPAIVGTYHVVASSVADPTRTATATVVVTAASAPPPTSPPPTAGSCDAEPMRTTGTTYYVCDCGAGSQAGCVAGNDANNGTSASTPWRSWSKAYTQFNTMAAGSTVAFCRGGAWNGLSSVLSEMRNQNCRADSASRAPASGDVQTCDMRDYPTSWGGTHKPILQFASGQSFMTMGWYEDNNGGWDASKVTGVRVLNLDLVGSNDGNEYSFYIWGRVQNLEICSNNFRDGWNFAYSGATTMTIKYVNFHHNRVTNNPYGIGAIQGVSCLQSCYWDSNYFDMNGGNQNRDHTIYIGGSPYGGSNWPTALVGANPQLCQGAGGTTACYAVAKDIRITNNEIRRSAWGAGGNGCNASAVIAHTPHSDLLIENNLFYEPPGTAKDGCYGIDLTSGIDMPGYLLRAVVRRNQIYNVNGNGITVGNCKDCVIEHNLVVGGSQAVQYPDPGNRCPSVAYPPTADYTCSGNLADSGGIIRNNTVYNGGDIAVNAMSGAVVTNNAVCGGTVTAPSGATVDHNLAAGSCSGWFTSPGNDPTIASFKPGPALSGTGGTVSEGSGYISIQPWSPADDGLPPSGPPNIGAVR
jgi:hypothetical protein